MIVTNGEISVELEDVEGSTLLDAIRKAGLPFAAPCAGKGTCGKCNVTVQDKSGVFTVRACATPAEGVLHVKISGAASLTSLDLFREAVTGNEHGVAIDLGSSTLDVVLVDLTTGTTIAEAGRMNPQIIYGSDVISRIEAAEAGHLGDLQQLILDALHDMILQLCSLVTLSPRSLSSITLAGNTIMLHLACSLSPAGIGIYPYQPLSFFGEHMELWTDLPPVWLAPCISGYVGGDVVAGMLAEQQQPSLLIDLGTNGEIALQTGKGSIAAATAAGPVFEGMNILYGMAALPGAIKSASYDEVTDQFSVEVIGGGEAKGICGSGLIDIIAFMLLHGLIDESGRLLSVNQKDRFFVLSNSEVVITQKDIRNLQLAKAAIAAGIEVVLDAAGLTPDDLASVAIAGGFGLHINKEHAAALGLIPHSLLSKTTSIGNSSLAGARAALLNAEARDLVVKLARETEYIELSTDTRFTEPFINNMSFEHTCSKL